MRSKDDSEMLLVVYVIMVEVQEHLLPRGGGDTGADFAMHFRQLRKQSGLLAIGILIGGLDRDAPRLSVVSLALLWERGVWWCESRADERRVRTLVMFVVQVQLGDGPIAALRSRRCNGREGR